MLASTIRRTSEDVDLAFLLVEHLAARRDHHRQRRGEVPFRAPRRLQAGAIGGGELLVGARRVLLLQEVEDRGRSRPGRWC